METENRLTVARGEGLGDWVEKVKALRSTDWCLQNSHRDVKYSTGNVINVFNIVLYMASRGYWKYHKEHLVKHNIRLFDH